jgi:hypothetical protein
MMLCRQGQPSALKSRGGERGTNGPLIAKRRMIFAAMQQCGASGAEILDTKLQCPKTVEHIKNGARAVTCIEP